MDCGGVGHVCGGDAHRDCPPNVRSRPVWLALAVIPMGWVSAVGVVQHLRRRMMTAGALGRHGFDPAAETVAGRAVPGAPAAIGSFGGGEYAWTTSASEW